MHVLRILIHKNVQARNFLIYSSLYFFKCGIHTVRQVGHINNLISITQKISSQSNHSLFLNKKSVLEINFSFHILDENSKEHPLTPSFAYLYQPHPPDPQYGYDIPATCSPES